MVAFFGIGPLVKLILSSKNDECIWVHVHLYHSEAFQVDLFPSNIGSQQLISLPCFEGSTDASTIVLENNSLLFSPSEFLSDKSTLDEP